MMCRHATRWALVPVGLLIGATLSGYCLGQLSPGQGAFPQAVSAYWSLTGNLNAVRSGHTATLLPDGKVLVVGGVDNNNILDSAELYDPATGTWSVTGQLNARHVEHTATLLPNGQVLVVGGGYSYDLLDSAELYDPGTGTWTRAGNPTTPTTSRGGHTATLLQTGKVLVAGGLGKAQFANTTMADTTVLYDPATGTWSGTGKLIAGRTLHQATLLQDGRVLVTGGTYDAENGPGLSSAEIYDPIAGTWSQASALNTARWYHSATLLPNGRVLVAGGLGPNVPTNAAELFDPPSGQWTSTGILNAARDGHTATLLLDGKVLVAGGYGLSSPIKGAELYDPSRGLWDNTGDLNAARSGHTATLLPNGKVLVAGGDNAGAVSTAELYQQPTDNSYRMTALFSDQAGLYQYIQLQNLASPTQPNHFAGQTLTVTTRKGVVKSFVFPNDPPTTTQPLCIATANVLPGTSGLDFIIPDLFIPTDGGTINFAGVDTWTFGPLPADGHSVVQRNGISPSGVLSCSSIAFFLAVPQDPVIEYYSAALDHYFMSASQPDLDALDSGRILGWTRTGYSFPVWITRYVDPAGEFGAPANAVDVCRIYIPPIDGDSHFFSASASECAAAQVQHPEFVLETTSAFLVTLPNPQTGACPPDQEPVYRLWNGRADSNHRYTTSIAVRDQMKARGYIAEGYGPDAVAMCAGGNI